MGNQTILIDFHSIEKILWRSVGTINCLVTCILQNIFCVQQKKEKFLQDCNRIFIFWWTIPLKVSKYIWGSCIDWSSLLNVHQAKCPSDVKIMPVMLCLQLKDLKRQLHLERKRADKLQERLQEILTNTKTRTGEHFLRPYMLLLRFWDLPLYHHIKHLLVHGI